MSGNHHRNSMTDIFFFVVIAVVVLLSLGVGPDSFKGLFKTVTAFFR